MTALHNFTEEELIWELVRRNGVIDAPTSRTIHSCEVLLGIGKNNHCYITFGERDDVVTLERMMAEQEKTE
jgi:hypothetical protein